MKWARAIFFSIALFGVWEISHASPDKQQDKRQQQAPCAVLEAFDGEVQVMNSDRSHLRDASLKLSISCGSWVSVIQGWARIKHQNGYRFQIGNQSFVQFPYFMTEKNFSKKAKAILEPNGTSQIPIDQVVLYRGQMFAEATNGTPELRIQSPVGRVRVRDGKVLFISREGDDEAQLIALKNSATLENRFEPTRRIKVRAGESTQLNFKLQRVIPSAPIAISVAALKPRIYGLQLPETDISEAIRLVTKRQTRRFASQLTEVATARDNDVKDERPVREGSSGKKAQSRRPASVVPVNPEENQVHLYLRNPPDKITPELHQHWVTKMVGGEPIGEQILFPDKFYGRSQKVQVEVEEAKTRKGQLVQKEQETEKKRLLEELSKIHVE